MCPADNYTFLYPAWRGERRGGDIGKSKIENK